MALRVSVLPPQKNPIGFNLEDVWQEWFLQYNWYFNNKVVIRKRMARRGLNNFWREVGTTDDGIPLSALVSDF